MCLLGVREQKNTGTGLQISGRSQLESSVSAGPEGSLVCCVWGVGKVSPPRRVLHGPGRVLRGAPTKGDWRSREV